MIRTSESEISHGRSVPIHIKAPNLGPIRLRALVTAQSFKLEDSFECVRNS